MVGRGSRADAMRQLGNVIINRATRLMMDVMKLTDRGISRLLHFHEHQRGNRLDILGRQMRGEPIHQLSPGPETVLPGHAIFGHPRHRALETVAVQIGNARQQCIDTHIIRPGTHPNRNL